MPIFGVGTLLGYPGSATNIDLQMSMAAQDRLMFSLIFVSDSCRQWCEKRAVTCECEASCLTRTPSFCCHDFQNFLPGASSKRYVCKVYLYRLHMRRTRWSCEGLTSIPQPIHWIQLKHLFLRLCTTYHCCQWASVSAHCSWSTDWAKAVPYWTVRWLKWLLV